MLPRRHPRPGRTERGFSLVEVIIAMTVLSIVMSGAAIAVVSSDSAEVRAKSVADSHAVAEKAIERLRQDLSARAGCDNGGWKDTARDVKLDKKVTETDFQPCLVTYQDEAMRDGKGRQYDVSLVIEPKDHAADGLGINDNDGDLRDAYEVETVVQLADGSTAGRESSEPIHVGGTVDWETGSTDDATIRLIACAIDRPDRGLIGGDCTDSGTTSRQAITITVPIAKVNESSGGTSPAGTITSGGAPAAIEPGAYRFNPPATYGSFRLLKLDPQNLRVYGSQNYTVHATYVRNDMRTRVCTQIAYWDTQPDDDGYEILRTNIHWRRTKQAGFRSMQLRLNGDGNPARGYQSGNGANRSWNCSHLLLDPVEAGASCPANPSAPTQTCPSLYRGLYDIEVEQVEHFSDPLFAPSSKHPRFKLQVTQARMNCTLASWNQPIGGTNLIGRGKDMDFERPDSPQKNLNSWYARMAINATSGTQTLCLRFHSKPFERERCYESVADSGVFDTIIRNNGTSQLTSGCFYVGTTCRLPTGTVDNDGNCWNGAEVCVANCPTGPSSGPAGTVGPVSYVAENDGVSGGPNDSTVPCTNSAGYPWPGSRLYGQSMGTMVPMGTILAHDWVGAGNTYYNVLNYTGRHSASQFKTYVHPDRFTYNLPDNPIFRCNEVAFSVSPNMLSTYPYYTCLEMHHAGRPGHVVRGRVLDVSSGSNTVWLTIGGAVAIAPDASVIQNHWNPFGTSAGTYFGTVGGWPSMANIARVNGDPVCNSGPGPQYVHVDPIIVEVWEKVIDEPGTRPLPPPPFTTNLGTDRIGV